MGLYEWARRWQVPTLALEELLLELGAADYTPPPPDGLTSEEAVQAQSRIDAVDKGQRLWRNNVGACIDNRGNHIRYGLANDSKRVNEKVKSSDLIGIDSRPITPDMVGQPRGQFVSEECKAPGWRYKGTPREEAQLAWLLFVASMGGQAYFNNGSERFLP